MDNVSVATPKGELWDSSDIRADYEREVVARTLRGHEVRGDDSFDFFASSSSEST